MLLNRLISVNSSLGYPCIVCGDFNSAPDTNIYRFLTQHLIPEDQFARFLLPTDHNDPDSNHLTKIVSSSIDGTLSQEYKNRTVKSPSEVLRIQQLKELLENSKKFPLLKSAYSNYTDLDKSMTPSKYWNGEPAYTSYAGWKGTLDYIFLLDGEETKKSLKLTAILSIPEERLLSEQTGLPSEKFPSDHLSIGATFQLLNC